MGDSGARSRKESEGVYYGILQYYSTLFIALFYSIISSVTSSSFQRE